MNSYSPGGIEYSSLNREEIKQKGQNALTNSKEWTWDKTAQKANEFLERL
jgi:hypothetical protein